MPSEDNGGSFITVELATVEKSLHRVFMMPIVRYLGAGQKVLVKFMVSTH